MFAQMKKDIDAIMLRDPAAKQDWRPHCVIPGYMPSGSIV